MCPSVVDITNAPNIGWKRIVFPPGGHMGSPLRRMVRTSKITRRILLSKCPCLEEKGVFHEKTVEFAYAPRWYPIVGADPCVRPWWALQFAEYEYKTYHFHAGFMDQGCKCPGPMDPAVLSFQGVRAASSGSSCRSSSTACQARLNFASRNNAVRPVSASGVGFRPGPCPGAWKSRRPNAPTRGAPG